MPGDKQVDLAAVIAAVDHPTRRRIIAVLRDGEHHVSALARLLEVSRPVLHVHLSKLEHAGLVATRIELGSDGKALRRCAVIRFDVRLTPETIAATLEEPSND
ncbi:MAG: ArsR/SmtB family transcription factor [Streptosporangiales bacterium]